MITNSRRTHLLVLGILILSLVLLAYQRNTQGDAISVAELQEGVNRCNQEDIRFRFSCYRSLIETHFKGRPADIAPIASRALAFHRQGSTYSIFGNNCHTFYHAIGDFLATYDDSTETALSRCPVGCQSGCAMGVSKRLSLRRQYDSAFFKDFYSACRPEDKHQCAHEIGHNLYDKYVVSILKTLDQMSADRYKLSYPETYHYQTFDTPAVTAAFESCRQIVPAEELRYCYTGIGHDLFLFSEFSPDGYLTNFNECANLPGEDSKTCLSYLVLRIGINDAAPKLVQGKTAEANSVCQSVASYTRDPKLERRCYLGMGGGIGFFAESEYLDRNETALDAITALARHCEQVPESFIQICYRGLVGTGFRKLYEKTHLSDSRIDTALGQLSAEAKQSDNDVFFMVE